MIGEKMGRLARGLVLIPVLFVTLSSITFASVPPAYLFSFGTGQLTGPRKVLVDGSGNIFVSDSDGDRVQKFAADGHLIRTINRPPGVGFWIPEGLAMDSQGNLYVTGVNTHSVSKFTPSGTFVASWGTEGSGDNQFVYPYSAVIDQADRLFVTDRGNLRIHKMTTDGQFLERWDGGALGTTSIWPVAVSLDGNGHLLLADALSDRIIRFTATGGFLGQFGSGGSGIGQFGVAPIDLAADPSGGISVVAYSRNKVLMFDSSGSFIQEWGDLGSGPGQFNRPRGIAFDPHNNRLYLVDDGNRRVIVFQTEVPVPTAPTTWSRLKLMIGEPATITP